MHNTVVFCRRFLSSEALNLVLQDQSQKMVVLCRAENKGWDVLPTVRKEENPDAIFVTISKNKRQFQ